jgi:DNA-binding XRE family transcriptional regulator
MNDAKRKRLEAAGWKFGSYADFLGLSKEEEMLVELKLALSKLLRDMRERSHISQQELAEKIGSSQSRIAKLEAGGGGASLDLMFKALYASGADTKKIARVVQQLAA